MRMRDGFTFKVVQFWSWQACFLTQWHPDSNLFSPQGFKKFACLVFWKRVSGVGFSFSTWIIIMPFRKQHTHGVADGSLSIKQEMSVGVCQILLDEEDAFALRIIICLCSNHKIWQCVFEGRELLTTFGLSIVQKWERIFSTSCDGNCLVLENLHDFDHAILISLSYFC